jgi:hypothetical protein
MRHPRTTDLALFAGEDLAFFTRHQVKRHLAGCVRCRERVEKFTAMRGELRHLSEFPDVHWGRLAAEMKANIHLGLEAGECVNDSFRFFPAGSAWLAYAGTLALLAIAVWIGLPGPQPMPANPPGAAVLAATGDGIELKQGETSFSLIHGRAGDVMLSVSAQGAMRARYLDAETGFVTVNNVYAQ